MLIKHKPINVTEYFNQYSSFYLVINTVFYVIYSNKIVVSVYTRILKQRRTIRSTSNFQNRRFFTFWREERGSTPNSLWNILKSVKKPIGVIRSHKSKDRQLSNCQNKKTTNVWKGVVVLKSGNIICFIYNAPGVTSVG